MEETREAGDDRFSLGRLGALGRGGRTRGVGPEWTGPGSGSSWASAACRPEICHGLPWTAISPLPAGGDQGAGPVARGEGADRRPRISVRRLVFDDPPKSCGAVGLLG